MMPTEEIIPYLRNVAAEYRADAERYDVLARRFQNRLLGNSRILRRGAEDCRLIAREIDYLVQVIQ